MGHRMLSKVADITGYILAGVGSTIWAGTELVAQVAPVLASDTPNGEVNNGGWILGVLGFLTVLVNKSFQYLHEQRVSRDKADESLQKLKDAQFEAATAKANFEHTQQLYNQLSDEAVDLRKKAEQIDENTRRIEEVSDAMHSLQKMGYLRPDDEDGSDTTEKPRILIVEDDAPTSSVLKRLFIAKGYIVHVAATVAEAKVKISRYDLKWIILDLVLPDGTGIDVLQYAHDSKTCRAKIFVVTGATDSASLNGVEALKPDAVLAKPFHFSYMWDLMAESGTGDFSVIRPVPPKTT